MNAATWWPTPLLQLLSACIPLSFGLGVLRVSPRTPFRAATSAAYLGLALALLAAAGGVVTPVDRTGATEPSLAAARLGHVFRFDGLTHVMLLLVAFIAVVIVRYSRTYLQGDAGQARYARAFLATLASVTLLVIANDLLVIALAWVGTSLALHQLLTFYRDRPQALVAAHKKFLVSRLADACMLGAVVLIGTAVGSLDLDRVNAWAPTSGGMGLRAQVAAALLVLAASLKSAQLPFHGWLIQVMEAPTPVSALLHAGVVNIGGFVIIRLAPFMAHAPTAQALLVVIGTLTADVAALVMTTRVSIKVALAWSTCAQMGFMLVECGLGLWHLALLHLVAHSLYKAHAFLTSGTVVDGWRVGALAPRRERVPLARFLGASVLVVASVAASVAGGWALLERTAPSPTLAPLTILLGLSIAPFVVRGIERGPRPLAGIALRSAGVGSLYFGSHVAAGYLLRSPEPTTVPLTWVVVLVGFVLLFGLQAVFECRPDGQLARALQPRLFAGLFLDELFTRMTFRLWPPRRKRPQPARRVVRVAEALEGQ